MYYKSLERREEYTRSIQNAQGARPKRKTFLLSRQKPIKSNKDKEWDSKYTLHQFTKVYKKESFRAWSVRSLSFNTLSFLSLHNVHIKQRGAALQAFSFPLHTEAPCQAIKFLLIEECRTHCTSKREKSKLHNIVAFLQNRSKWSLVSSSILHK